MDIRLVAKILKVAGFAISMAGSFVDGKIQAENTQKAVDRYMTNYMNNALALANNEINREMVNIDLKKM